MLFGIFVIVKPQQPVKYNDRWITSDFVNVENAFVISNF